MSSSIIAGVNVDDISRHLNCPLCKRLIRTPKLLPCLHSFCQSCTEGLAEKVAPNEFLTCSLCKTDAKIAKEDVESLPINFFLDNMLDIALINSSDREPVPCSNCDSNSAASSRCVDCGEFLCENCYNVHKRIRQTKEHKILTISELLDSKTGEDLHRPAFCRIHHSEQLKYYCETCNEAVCRDCVLMEHRQHKYDYIKDSKKIQKQKTIMENLYEECAKNIPVLEKSVNQIQGISDTLRGRLSAVKAEIRDATLQQIKILKEKERKLLLEADRIHNAKATILRRQKDHLEGDFARFKAGCDFSEQVLKYANEVELLSLKSYITEKLTELKDTELDCQPHENAELKYEVNSKEAETVVSQSLGSLKTIGPVLDLEDIEMPSSANGSESGADSPEDFRQEIPLSVEVRDPSGVLLPPETIHQADGHSFTAYHPFFNGIFSFSVFVRGQAVEGFPLDINIGDIRPRVGSAKKAIAGSGSKFGKLGDPQGVAVGEDGSVIVSDSRNHRIQVFDMDGNFRFRFGSPGSRDGHFQFPSGVAVSKEGNIVVADTMNNRIQILTKEGKFIKKFGKGAVEGERMYQPYGVALDNQDRIFVVDRGSARVLVFSQDGQILLTFGSLGDGKGQFNCPTGVAVNSKGHVIITDFGNDRVQVFDSKGQFLFKFGKSGRADGELNWPTGVTTDADDHIIVSDSYNHRIQIFNEDGSFLTRFGNEGNKRGQFKRPEGVAVTKQGNIVVADWGNDRIQVF